MTDYHTDKPFSEILEIDETPRTARLPATVEGKSVTATETLSVDPKKLQSDFERARDNITSVLENAQQAMVIAFEIAKDKEDAQSFQALNGLLKTISQTSLDLVKVHKELKEISAPTASAGGGNTTMNIDKAVFTGTPKQLRDLVNKRKAGETPPPQDD